MTYDKKLFNPGPSQDFRTAKVSPSSEVGDRRDGKLYLYEDDIVLAVNVALATGRPLLVSGPSGSGKSSLAQNAALYLKRRYYEFVVTARTQAQDLTWRFDAVRRLADAQAWRLVAPDAALGAGARDFASLYRYIEPRELWWICDPAQARRRGREEPDPNDEARDPSKWVADAPHAAAVLLIDEIDKADPDVPNNLLVPLGSLEFDVDLLDLHVSFTADKQRIDARPLIFITTNGERPLPAPFLRRCVTLQLKPPDDKRLLAIAKLTFKGQGAKLYAPVLKAIRQSKSGPGGNAAQPDVSIAEYIDAVRAVLTLKLPRRQLDDALLSQILEKTVWKEVERPRG
jgi:MoxR-like ATPase